MLPQLHVVVRRWRGGGSQPVRRGAERITQHPLGRAGEALEDAGLVQHDATEGGGIQLWQPFVVGNVDARPGIGLLADDAGFDADGFALADHLTSNRQRRQDQRWLVGGSAELSSRCGFNTGLAQSGVQKGG